MSDHRATRFPVSVKAVLTLGGTYPLLLNERDEWELPGGKLEAGEDIAECIVREVKEELNINAGIVRPIDNWVYRLNNLDIVIITYLLESADSVKDARVSHEHKKLQFFDTSEIAGLNMPRGYKNSILLARRDGR